MFSSGDLDETSPLENTTTVYKVLCLIIKVYKVRVKL